MSALALLSLSSIILALKLFKEWSKMSLLSMSLKEEVS
jgi:hypothetical protein